MKTRDEIAPVFEQALQLLDGKEKIYGDSWKRGKEVCLSGLKNKATYILNKLQRGEYPSFEQDLLDLINWSGFCCKHLQEQSTGKLVQEEQK